MITKNFFDFRKYLVAGYLLTSITGIACVDLDIVNQADKPIILTGFSQHYSDVPVTSDMEFDPTESQTLAILIQYDRLVKYRKELKDMKASSLGQDEKDFLELTIGEDDFVLYWDENSQASLKKNHAGSYDAILELVPTTGHPSKNRYRFTLIKKPS